MSYQHRTPHIMKKTKTVSIPSNLLFFDTETNQEVSPDDPNTQRNTLWFGYALAYRMEDNKKTRASKVRFNNVDTFWKFVVSRLDKNRPLYVFAHNLCFDYTIMDGWEVHEDYGFTTSYAVLESTPFILQLSHENGKAILVDTFNYWKTSLADIGASIGYPKGIMPETKEDTKAWNEYCYRDVEVLSEMVSRLMQYLKDTQLGSFGVSAPAIAFNIFKTSFMNHDIYLHDRPRVLKLERDAYYGGLVNNFYVGKIANKKTYWVDVNSLYPYVMKLPLPTKMIGNVTDCQPSELLTHLDEVEGIAEVLLESKDDPYPRRYNGRLCETVGRVATYLAGPELRRGLEKGHIKHVRHASLYEVDTIFSDFVDHFWNERCITKAKGDTVGNLFAKLIMNSLYGRFGMKGRHYEPYSLDYLTELYAEEGKEVPKCYKVKGFQPPISALSNTWRPMGLRASVKLRYLDGMLEVERSTGEHAQSFVAISAFVTAYAREYLRELIAIAGRHEVHYCDTDSLFTTERGYQRLVAKRLINPNELGKLKLEGIADSCTFNGPKDYIFGGIIKRKGIRKNAKQLSDKIFEQDQFEGIKSIMKRGCKPFIDVRKVNKRLAREYSKGRVTTSGRVEYFRMSDW